MNTIVEAEPQVRDTVIIKYHTWMHSDDLEKVVAQTEARKVTDFGDFDPILKEFKPENKDIFRYDSTDGVDTILYACESFAHKPKDKLFDSIFVVHGDVGIQELADDEYAELVPPNDVFEAIGGSTKVRIKKCTPEEKEEMQTTEMRMVDFAFKTEVDLADENGVKDLVDRIEAHVDSLVPDNDERRYVDVKIRKATDESRINLERAKGKRSNFEFNGEYYPVSLGKGYVEVSQHKSDHYIGVKSGSAPDMGKGLFPLLDIPNLVTWNGADGSTNPGAKTEKTKQKEKSEPELKSEPKSEPKEEERFGIRPIFDEVYSFAMAVEGVLPRRTVKDDVEILDDSGYIDYELGLLEDKILSPKESERMIGGYLSEAKRFMNDFDVPGKRKGEFYETVGPRLKGFAQERWKNRNKRRRARKQGKGDPLSVMIAQMTKGMHATRIGHGISPVGRSNLGKTYHHVTYNRPHIPTKEEAWDLVSRERQSEHANAPKEPKMHKADAKLWNHLEKYGSDIWTYVYPESKPGKGDMKVLGLHTAEGVKPMMWVFDEHIGGHSMGFGMISSPDVQRGNSSHVRSFRAYYFMEDGNFFTAEGCRDMVHYLCGGSFSPIQELDLEDPVVAAMSVHPDRSLRCFDFGSYMMKLNEYQGNGHDNMMRDEVFGSYMNPALVDVVAEEVTAKRIKNSARWSFGRADDKPVKAPEFSLKSGFDKQEMLFKMMEMCKPDVSYR